LFFGSAELVSPEARREQDGHQRPEFATRVNREIGLGSAGETPGGVTFILESNIRPRVRRCGLSTLVLRRRRNPPWPQPNAVSARARRIRLANRYNRARRWLMVQIRIAKDLDNVRATLAR
jgi:hypothetical protein